MAQRPVAPLLPPRRPRADGQRALGRKLIKGIPFLGEA
jgi:hypothetical protein